MVSFPLFYFKMLFLSLGYVVYLNECFFVVCFFSPSTDFDIYIFALFGKCIISYICNSQDTIKLN